MPQPLLGFAQTIVSRVQFAETLVCRLLLRRRKAVDTIGMDLSRESEELRFERFLIEPWPAWFAEEREVIGHVTR